MIRSKVTVNSAYRKIREFYRDNKPIALYIFPIDESDGVYIFCRNFKGLITDYLYLHKSNITIDGPKKTLEYLNKYINDMELTKAIIRYFRRDFGL